MCKSHFGIGRQIPLVLLLVFALIPGVGSTRSDTGIAKAVGLIHKAMDAYANLDFDTCMASLNKARDLAKEIDRRTLARVYEGFGVLWSGGYAENAKGTSNFLIATCLDNTLEINPLFLTPEVEILFKLAKEQATDEKCSEVLGSIVIPEGSTQAAVPSIAPCGEHDPLRNQKQKYELPFYVATKSEMRSTLSRVVVRYAFDGGNDYKEMELPMRGSGYGALLSCDEGQIRIFDPATVAYYIEGMDANGGVICGHGTEAAPYEVLMLPDAAPLGSIAGLQAQECAPCPPWDENCGRIALPGEGEACMPDSGCASGFVCGDSGICDSDGSKKRGGHGPKKFYINVLAGTGVGFLKQDITIKRINSAKSPEGFTGDPSKPLGLIEEDIRETSGMAWSGIPLRLAVGFFVLPKLSLEVSARFDVYVTSKVTPKSCWEVAGESIDGVKAAECSNSVDFDIVDDAKEESVAKTIPGYEEAEDFQYAWMVNARVRYEIFRRNALAINLFGGVGYGHFQYRVKPKKRSSTDTDVNSTADDSRDSDTPFFPMTGMVDLELGVSMAYFFNDHVGLIVEVPFDFLFGSGFSANADLTLGLGFGF